MDTYVEVTGRGSASAPTDAVVVELAVRAVDERVDVALSRAGELAAAVHEALAAAGVAPRDLQTSGASAHPRFDPATGDAGGCEARQAMTVVCRGLDAAGPVVEAATAAAGDALELFGLTLVVGDPVPLRSLARERALGDAQARALDYARLAGRSLGELLRVVERDGASGGAVAAAGESLRSGLLPIAAGESAVTTVVTARYALV